MKTQIIMQSHIANSVITYESYHIMHIIVVHNHIMHALTAHKDVINNKQTI